MIKQQYNIPAGFPYHCAVKISRSPVGSSPEYTDITDPSLIPSTGWALCFCDNHNNAALVVPLDWSQMDEGGYIPLTLTAEQTLALAGRRLRVEVRNNDAVSSLMDDPMPIFYFVPNDLHI